MKALRLPEEYQYGTTSDYSATISEPPVKVGPVDPGAGPSNIASVGTLHSDRSGFKMAYSAVPQPVLRGSLDLPCFLLDSDAENDDFRGREDILGLIAAELLPSKTDMAAVDTGPRQFALCGFGGIGKTEIAREFVRREKTSFDAVFWVIADGTAKLDEHFQQISLALGLEDSSESKSQVVSREIVKGWLSHPYKDQMVAHGHEQFGSIRSEATWLLVFDNADDPMVLADYWPQGKGSILITSRDPQAKHMFSTRSSGMDLGPLPPHDSLSLFYHLTHVVEQPEDEVARRISNALGGIPLAISQMAGIISREGLTFSEFLDFYLLQEEHGTLYETKFNTSLVPYRHSLSTVWAVDKLSSDARQLLELIAFLDPDMMEDGFLTELLIAPLPEENVSWQRSYLAARSDLLQSSLVQRSKQEQCVSVHRIVQDVVLAKINVSQKTALFDHIMRNIWTRWPSALPTPSKQPVLPKPISSGRRLHVGRWPACEALYPHALRMHSLWTTLFQPSDGSSLLFARLLTEAAWYVLIHNCDTSG
nr:hypothetical protein CFP56_11599 [Quercus suber]